MKCSEISRLNGVMMFIFKFAKWQIDVSYKESTEVITLTLSGDALKWYNDPESSGRSLTIKYENESNTQSTAVNVADGKITNNTLIYDRVLKDVNRILDYKVPVKGGIYLRDGDTIIVESNAFDAVKELDVIWNSMSNIYICEDDEIYIEFITAHRSKKGSVTDMVVHSLDMWVKQFYEEVTLKCLLKTN